MENNWKFIDDRLYHTPCRSLADVDDNNKIVCRVCKESIPPELELPAQVYGTYKYKWAPNSALGDMLLNPYSPKNISQLSNLPTPIWKLLNDVT